VDELFRVQKRIRKSAHQKNIHEYQPVGNPFRQNNDTSVHVTITKDELYKSQIRLTHRFRLTLRIAMLARLYQRLMVRLTVTWRAGLTPATIAPLMFPIRSTCPPCKNCSSILRVANTRITSRACMLAFVHPVTSLPSSPSTRMRPHVLPICSQAVRICLRNTKIFASS
jgi:hypothetical protein